MALILELPEQIEKQLFHRAVAQERSPETVVLEILQKEFLPSETAFPSPEEIVQKIQSLPPNPQAVRPAQGSLAEALSNAQVDPDFDLAEWNQEWLAIEAELKTLTQANDQAEGR